MASVDQQIDNNISNQLKSIFGVGGSPKSNTGISPTALANPQTLISTPSGQPLGATNNFFTAAAGNGKYIAFASVTAILLANTAMAPILAGILGLGVLYQVQQLLSGSNTLV
jgi:hypothetical protein